MAQPDGPYADRISIPPEDDPAEQLPPLPPKWSEYDQRLTGDVEQRLTKDVLRPALAEAGVPDPERYELAFDSTPLGAEFTLTDVGPANAALVSGYDPAVFADPHAGADVTERHDPGQPEEYAGADVPDPWAEPGAGAR